MKLETTFLQEDKVKLMQDLINKKLDYIYTQDWTKYNSIIGTILIELEDESIVLEMDERLVEIDEPMNVIYPGFDLYQIENSNEFERWFEESLYKKLNINRTIKYIYLIRDTITIEFKKEIEINKFDNSIVFEFDDNSYWIITNNSMIGESTSFYFDNPIDNIRSTQHIIKEWRESLVKQASFDFSREVIKISNKDISHIPWAQSKFYKEENKETQLELLKPIPKKKTRYKSKKPLFNDQLLSHVTYTGKHQYPKCFSEVTKAPVKLISYKQALRELRKPKIHSDVFVYFTYEDYEFINEQSYIWKDYIYVGYNSGQFKGAILPNFGISSNLPYGLKLRNNYFKQWFGFFLNQVAINFINNVFIDVTDGIDDDYYLDGLSNNEILFINTSPLVDVPSTIQLFIQKLEKLLNLKKPKQLLFKGYLNHKIIEYLEKNKINYILYDEVLGESNFAFKDQFYGFNPLYNNLLNTSTFEDFKQIPIIQDNIIEIDKEIITIDEAKSKIKTGSELDNKIIAFYKHDYILDGKNGIWQNPDKNIDILNKAYAVIEPDYSTYLNMSYSLKLYQTLRMRLSGLYLQECGIKVITNYRSSSNDCNDFVTLGIPNNCTIAISVESNKTIDDFKRIRDGLILLHQNKTIKKVALYGNNKYLYYVTDFLQDHSIEYFISDTQTVKAYKNIKDKNQNKNDDNSYEQLSLLTDIKE